MGPMCSEGECRERQRTLEVSEWEATLETMTAKRKVMDPRYAVAKYRRSAAGTRNKRRPRSVSQLRTTWEHLLYLVSNQHRQDMSFASASLVSTVSFVDDRVRAMQVDLVLTQRSAPDLQIQLIRYHLLMLYLLLPLGRNQFEPKFAKQALSAAFSAYSHEDDQEVIAYRVLCRVAAHLETATAETEPVLESYKKRGESKHVLRIATAAHVGFYRNVLCLLSEMTGTFGVLCRICMAPALNVIRLRALQQYNKSFMKREAIAAEEVARLLFLPQDEAARFCSTLGFPVEENKILFKAAPVVVPTNNSEWARCSRAMDDGFVLGDFLDAGRVDEHGIKIPHPSTIKRLISST